MFKLRISAIFLISTFLSACNGLECYKCSPTENDNCREIKDSTQKQICGTNEVCSSRLDDAGNLELGCTEPISNPNKAVECSTDLCNVNTMVHTCYSCDEANKLDCRSELSTAVTDGTLEPICFTCQRKDKTFYRGVAQIPDANCESCNVEAEGENCNSRVHKCFKCTDCKEIDETTPKASCDIEDVCLVAISQTEEIVRGCSPELPGCQPGNPENCKSCEGDICNDETWQDLEPKQCYQCRGTSQCEQEQKPSALRQCFSAAARKCFLYVNGNDEVVRGCETDEDFRDCEKYPQSCKTFEDDGGNFEDVVNHDFSCALCSSNESCAWAQEPDGEEIKVCNFFTYETPKCFKALARSVANNVVNRGCYEGRGPTCQATDEISCELCDESKCNLDTSKVTRCFECNSDNDQACAESTVPNEFLKQCPQETFRNRGCFINVQGSTVTRGCVANLAESHVCKESFGNCKICQTEFCNDGPPQFPTKCLQCTNSDECDKEQNAADAKVCDDPNNSDVCFTYFESQTNHVVRGCSNINGSADCKKAEACLISDSGQNYQPLYLKFDCAKCSNAQECQKQQNEKDSENCNFKYFEQAGCFTRIEDNDTVWRGCAGELSASDLLSCKGNGDVCQYCEKTSCNINAVDREQSQTNSTTSSTTNSDTHSTESSSVVVPQHDGAHHLQGFYSIFLGATSAVLLLVFF